MRILALTALVVFFWTPGAEAACSGGGQTWSCTTGTTSSELSSTLGSASDGATLTFAPGSYSWNAFVNFSNTKGASLVCQSPGACNVAVSGNVLGMNGSLSGTNNHFYRISGFAFSGGNNFVIWFYGPGVMTNVRIDHNSFTGQNPGSTLIFFGENSTIAYFYGLVDHNTVTNASSVALAQMVGAATTTAPVGTRGTSNNMYFEDNTITIATQTNAGLGCIDSWGGASIVWRYNTTTNCLVTSHGVSHAWGPVNWEVYGNRFIVDSGASSSFRDCWRCFHHQGSGEFLAFDNVFTASAGKSPEAISMTHYRSASPSAAGYSSAVGRCDGTSSNDGNRSGQLGYPCRRQPGRDANGTLQPMYVWLNRWSIDGSLVRMVVENPWGATNPGVSDHVAADRDYYNAVSASAQSSPTGPFNATTGMGFGILANRPPSCTTGAAADAGRGGVGYWATDQGRLYRCSATNTWTLHYTPFAYPHPLQAGGPPPVPAPSAPLSLRILS